jgi:hypothetical protein
MIIIVAKLCLALLLEILPSLIKGDTVPLDWLRSLQRHAMHTVMTLVK